MCDPSVALSPAALRTGAWYTDGNSLSVCLPPTVAPNLIRDTEFVTRTFSLCGQRELSAVPVQDPPMSLPPGVQPAHYLGDVCCDETRLPSICYDAANNMVWAYNEQTNTIHRWKNTAASPRALAAIKLDLPQPAGPSGAILSYLDRFATPLGADLAVTTDNVMVRLLASWYGLLIHH